MLLAAHVGPGVAGLEGLAAEVTIGGRQLIHGMQQVEHARDRVGTQIEMLAYQLDDLGIADLAGTEGIHRHGGRLGHADGIGDLDLAALGQARRDDVLGHVAASVGGAAVDLGRILAGERATTMTRHATVGIDDDLATGQSAVAHRPADDEVAGRVDVILGGLGQPFGGDHFLDDLALDHLAQLVLIDVRIVLGGEHHGVDGTGLALRVVAEGQLTLGVRAQPRQQPVLTQLGLTLHQPVRVMNRRRHVGIGFVGGIAEHQALVAGPLILGFGTIDPLGDVHALLADQVEHAAGVAIEAHVRRGIADIVDDATNQIFQVDPGGGRDFAGHDGDTGLDHGFAGHACLLVAGDDGIQHRVGNLIGDLVRVSLGDGFGSKQGVFVHGVLDSLYHVLASRNTTAIERR